MASTSYSVSSSTKIIKLTSSDGEELVVNASAAAKWNAIKNVLTNAKKTKNHKKRISIRDVTGVILSKVIDYSERHADAEIKFSVRRRRRRFKHWATKFFKTMSQEELNLLNQAAQSLGYEKLADASWKKMEETVDAVDTSTQGPQDAASVGFEEVVDAVSEVRFARLPGAFPMIFIILMIGCLIGFLLRRWFKEIGKSEACRLGEE